jgi:predicted nucleotidyltransferase
MLGSTAIGAGPADALDLVRPLLDDHRVHGAILFGSFARHQANERSDVDVLVAHRDAVPEDLLDVMPEHVAVSFYRPQRLSALPRSSPLFAVHVAREGLVLSDRDGFLSTVLKQVRALDNQTIARTLTSTRERLAELRSQPHGLHLDVDATAAELYAIAKQGAMLLGAAESLYEFDRRAALVHAYERIGLSLRERDLIDGLEESWHALRAVDDVEAPRVADVEAAAAAVEQLLEGLVL